MRGRALALAAAMLCAGSGVSQAAESPLQLYGGPIEFQIRRNGSDVGQERVTFQQRGGATVATATADIAVRLLIITAYEFHYSSTSIWRDGAMRQDRAATDDNGKKTTVDTVVQGQDAIVTGPAGRLTLPAPAFATDHWNMAELKHDTVINNIDGKIDHVTVTDAGPDQVQTLAGPRAAEKYVYSGDLKFTAWYDSAGRWVGLRFSGKDGSTIDYVCRKCGP